MTRLTLPNAMSDNGIVAVLRGLSTERALSVVAAAAAGGLSVFEVTMDSPTPARTIQELASRGYCVGAGTVLSQNDVRLGHGSGAQFLVAPNTDTNVIEAAAEVASPMVPGAFTPTEVASAWALNVAAVKLFPAHIGGPALVKSLKGPLGSVPLMVTGGIQADNVADYLSAGASWAGVGGWLTGVEDLQQVTHRAELLVLAAAGVNV